MDPIKNGDTVFQQSLCDRLPEGISKVYNSHSFAPKIAAVQAYGVCGADAAGDGSEELPVFLWMWPKVLVLELRLMEEIRRSPVDMVNSSHY